jgi:hypothetical protein
MDALKLKNGVKIKINNEIYTVNDCILSGKGELNGKHLLTLNDIEFDTVHELTCYDIPCDKCPLKYFDCQEVIYYSDEVDEHSTLTDIAKNLIQDDPELLQFILKRLKG